MSRRTPQRVAIEAAFADAGRPLGPQEVLESARGAVPAINLATVYRTLSRMVDEGEIVQVDLPNEPPRYELTHVAEHHHHHFRCDNCHAVYDLEGCVDGLKRMLPADFKMTGHNIVLYGLCPKCVGEASVAPD